MKNDNTKKDMILKKTKGAFCKFCGKFTKHENEFCTPEEGRKFYEKEKNND